MPTSEGSQAGLTGSVWLRPQRINGGQPNLTRQQIVTAAIEILDAEGAGGLNMRSLAGKLRAGAASLYWHVGNKDELLELALDEVQGEIVVPEVAAVGWRAAAGALARGVHDTAVRHPWMIGLIGTKPPIGPNAMALSDAAAAMLAEAGFAGMAVAHTTSLLVAYAFGAAAMENSCRQTAVAPAGGAVALQNAVEVHWQQVAEQYPSLAQWRDTPQPTTLYAETFAFGLDRILDGIEAWRREAGDCGPDCRAAAE